MPKILLTLAIFILLQQNVLAINYSSYIDYLSKTVEAVDDFSPRFSQTELTNHNDILLWLENIDSKLSVNDLTNYDSELLISFANNGYINKISIAELNEDNFEKFKVLISKLENYKFAELPQSIDPNTVFKLDTSTLYLERNPSYLKVQNLEKNNNRNVEENIKLLNGLKQIEAELLKPNYIDYPNIGEILTLKINKDLIVNAKVIQQSNKSITVSIKQIDNRLVNWLFTINKPHKDFHSSGSRILASGLSAAASAGIAGSISSYGILPGALGIASSLGTALKEINDQVSFNLSRGDKLTLLAIHSF